MAPNASSTPQIQRSRSRGSIPERRDEGGRLITDSRPPMHHTRSRGSVPGEDDLPPNTPRNLLIASIEQGAATAAREEAEARQSVNADLADPIRRASPTEEFATPRADTPRTPTSGGPSNAPIRPVLPATPTLVAAQGSTSAVCEGVFDTLYSQKVNKVAEDLSLATRRLQMQYTEFQQSISQTIAQAEARIRSNDDYARKVLAQLSRQMADQDRILKRYQQNGERQEREIKALTDSVRASSVFAERLTALESRMEVIRAVGITESNNPPPQQDPPTSAPVAVETTSVRFRQEDAPLPNVPAIAAAPARINMADESHRPARESADSTVSAITLLARTLKDMQRPERRSRSDSEERYYSSRASAVDPSDFEPLPFESRGRSGPWQRPKGKAEPGLEEHKVSFFTFRHVASYRTYRLKWYRPAEVVDGKLMKKNLQNLGLHLGTLFFDGSDPIRIISFLYKVADTCDRLHVSEYEAYLSLKHFLKDDTRTLFDAAVGAADISEGAILNWPSATAYPHPAGNG